MRAWPPVVDGGKEYDLSHLDPFSLDVTLGKHEVTLSVGFESHTFSDEKGRGVRIPFIREERYFCRERYDTSFEAAEFMEGAFLDSHVRTFINKKRRQQFYTLDCGTLALFMTIQKSAEVDNELKCKVISAYDPTWSKGLLPNGKLYGVRTVLKRRLEGLSIPVR